MHFKPNSKSKMTVLTVALLGPYKSLCQKYPYSYKSLWCKGTLPWSAAPQCRTSMETGRVSFIEKAGSRLQMYPSCFGHWAYVGWALSPRCLPHHIIGPGVTLYCLTKTTIKWNSTHKQNAFWPRTVSIVRWLWVWVFMSRWVQIK